MGNTRLRSYQDLDAWQNAVQFAVSVYRLSARFPKDERFELTKQLRRAAVSVAVNTAEGAGRNGTREYIQFLGIACGSLAEADTHLVISRQLGFSSDEECRRARELAAEIGRLLTGLKRSLRNHPPRP